MKIAAFNLSGQGSFAQDAPAIADAVKSSGADIVLLPGTSRVRRAVGAAEMRAGAEVDTNVVDLAVDGETVMRRGTQIRPGQVVGYAGQQVTPSHEGR